EPAVYHIYEALRENPLLWSRASSAARPIAPSRTMRSDPDASTTVEGNPPGVGPQSTINSTSSCNVSCTASGVCAGVAHALVALVPGSGPGRSINSHKGRQELSRTPTLRVPAVKPVGRERRAGKRMVRGPGQKASIRLEAAEGTSWTNEDN